VDSANIWQLFKLFRQTI